MNPLWLLLAAVGALTFKGGATQTTQGGVPQSGVMFDPNLPPDIAARVIDCAARCQDPQQMLQFAGELARAQFPVAATFLHTRAAMLIQARAAQPQQLPQPQAPVQPTAPAPQVQGTAPAASPLEAQPRQIKNIVRTMTPEQAREFEIFLERQAATATAATANGTAPKPTPTDGKAESTEKVQTA